MPLLEHLREFRKRIVKAAIAVMAGSIIWLVRLPVGFSITTLSQR
jgi:hypothetical protein